MKNATSFQYYLLLIGLSIVFFSGCRDKCEDEPILDFTIGQELTISGWRETETRLLESDTMWKGSSVTFSAVEGFDNYRWEIGTDARTFTDPDFSLTFNLEGSIQVTLIADRPYSECPDVAESDTITKNFVLVESDFERWVGEYRGVMVSAPLDTFNVQVIVSEELSDPPFSSVIVVDNFPNGCVLEGTDGAAFFSYDYFVMRGAPDIDCFIPTSWARRDDFNNLTIETYFKEEGTEDTFNGKKIN